MKSLKTGFFLVLLLALAGMASGAVIGKDDQSFKAIADPILGNIMSAFNEGNYQNFSKDFDDTMKETVTEQKFKQLRTEFMEKFGKYQSASFLGALQQKSMSVVLYRGTFNKSEGDVLIKLVCSKRQDRILVTGLWFQ